MYKYILYKCINIYDIYDMYKYINIQYEIFLTEFVYSKTTLFYIKKYFFLKNSVNLITKSK